MKMTPEMKAIRKQGIGGSEIAAIVGENPWQSSFDVWVSKTTDWEQPIDDNMKRGIFLEKGILDWYLDRTDETLMQLPEHGFVGPHPSRCSPDAVTNEGIIVSIKSPARGGPWWGPYGSGIVPTQYMLQLQWEHHVLSNSVSYGMSDEMRLAALVDGELRIYKIQADKTMQQNLQAMAEAWWQTHIVNGVKPIVMGTENTMRYLTDKRALIEDLEQRDATQDEALLMVEHAEIKKEMQRLNDRIDIIKNRLRDSIGASDRIISPTHQATWNANKNGVRSLLVKEKS